MHNNPMMVLMQNRIRQAVRQDPRAQQLEALIRGKSPQEQQQLFFNMCREQGIAPREFAGRFGVQI